MNSRRVRNIEFRLAAERGKKLICWAMSHRVNFWT